jgi:ATP-binding cassette subfamily A (ABC1) protein 3
MSNCLIIMTISLFLFFFIGLYLDNTLPSAYGLRKGWCFCLSPDFCCRKKAGLRRKGSKNSIDAESQDETYFEAKYMKKQNFEPIISRDLLKLDAEGKVLKVSELQKKFDNGFHAVKGINVKMYNGQIFALLGHNGAGKTTTISMLTGLIESSQGSAEVFGVDLFENMDEVRQFLGVCPQHDILFE